MLNKVILVGRITKDPELRHTSSGIAYVNFTIAADSLRRDQDGKFERKADFINCVAWRSQADFLGNYIKKGYMLCVEGKLQSRSYQPTGSTETRYVTEVSCESVQNLQPRGSSSSFNNNDDYSSSNEASYSASDDTYRDTHNIDVDDDDLPF